KSDAPPRSRSRRRRPSGDPEPLEYRGFPSRSSLLRKAGWTIAPSIRRPPASSRCEVRRTDGPLWRADDARPSSLILRLSARDRSRTARRKRRARRAQLGLRARRRQRRLAVAAPEIIVLAEIDGRPAL